ncbi:hypothetical protein [Cohaesibacter haloalkalitolerans]|uniref:hypothetical protein n=1 Tax=Cohaesibacter haloalkalitolerans TaxID=1162980 RepID=UPI0013C42210|nr:hypothetical protein [Cohaesibacter haloalkalitolerans]
MADAEHCNAMCESDHQSCIADFGVDIDAAIEHFHYLLEPKITNVSGFSVDVSYVQSGLGNREEKALRFDSRTACEAFVDQLAQRAVEGRGRC